MSTEEWGDMSALRSVAEALTDAIKVRTACDNRAQHGGADYDRLRKDAVLTGPAHAMERAYREALLLEYERAVPEHVREWLAGIPGLGDGVLPARILGHLGDPRYAVPWRWEGKQLVPDGEGYERTPAVLWAYAGCGDPALSPCYGYRQDSRERTLAVGKRTTVRACLRAWTDVLVRAASPGAKGYPQSEAAAASPYWKVYTEAREAAESKTHARQCQNRKRPPMSPNGCGTAAHPEWGKPGSPWRPGHMRAHAHRIVHKQFLLDLWVVSE